MFKIIFTVAVLAFCSSTSAQDQSASPAREFISTSSISDTFFSLIHPSVYVPAAILKSIRREALRVLPGEVYIVERSFLKKINPSYVTTITPANNKWKLSSSAKSLLVNNVQERFRFALQFKDAVSLKSFVSKNDLMHKGNKNPGRRKNYLFSCYFRRDFL